LNPMAAIIEAYRGALLHGRWPDAGTLGFAGLVSGAVLLGGYLYFKRVEGSFADVI
jgi:ABC-type polysaccharide/polyol phosphate export permease